MKFLNITQSTLIFALVVSIVSGQIFGMDQVDPLVIPPAPDHQVAQENLVAPVQATPQSTALNLTSWAIWLTTSGCIVACAIAHDKTGLPYPLAVQATYLGITVGLAATLKTIAGILKDNPGWTISLATSSCIVASAIAHDTTGLPYPLAVKAMYLAEIIGIATILKKAVPAIAGKVTEYIPVPEIVRSAMYLPVRLGKWALGMK